MYEWKSWINKRKYLKKILRKCYCKIPMEVDREVGSMSGAAARTGSLKK